MRWPLLSNEKIHSCQVGKGKRRSLSDFVKSLPANIMENDVDKRLEALFGKRSSFMYFIYRRALNTRGKMCFQSLPCGPKNGMCNGAHSNDTVIKL